MSVKHFVFSAALAAALFSGASTFAGEGCCGGDSAASCNLGECDDKLAKATDAILAKLAAPAPKLSAEDQKVAAEAHHTLMTTCPVGGAFMHAFPTILEAVEAVHALDAALADGGKTLPADCQTKEGGCAFCAEAGSKCSDAAKQAMSVNMKAMGRAEKLAKAMAAAMPSEGMQPTTKPAGQPVAIPTKEQYAKLVAKIDEATKMLKEGFEKKAKLGEADNKKIEASQATLAKLYPTSGPTVLFPAYMQLFAEVKLAAKSVAAYEAASPMKADAKLEASLSPNAKNAYALIGARMQLVSALGHTAEAMPCDKCAEGAAEGKDCCKEKMAGDKKGEAKAETPKQ